MLEQQFEPLTITHCSSLNMHRYLAVKGVSVSTQTSQTHSWSECIPARSLDSDRELRWNEKLFQGGIQFSLFRPKHLFFRTNRLRTTTRYCLPVCHCVCWCMCVLFQEVHVCVWFVSKCISKRISRRVPDTCVQCALENIINVCGSVESGLQMSLSRALQYVFLLCVCDGKYTDWHVVCLLLSYWALPWNDHDSRAALLLLPVANAGVKCTSVGVSVEVTFAYLVSIGGVCPSSQTGWDTLSETGHSGIVLGHEGYDG